MAQVSVSVYFEAADSAEAEAKIAKWVLHDGCKVSVTTMPAPIMLEATGDGTLQPQTLPSPPEPLAEE